MIALFSLVTGLIFGIGLIVSGMADPSTVLGFLDLAGAWNPSLACVMSGAIGVGLVCFGLARRRTRSILGARMAIPSNTRIDRRLILGSTAFGIGWGLAGICPGPGVVLIGMGSAKGLVFGLSMLGGMGMFAAIERR